MTLRVSGASGAIVLTLPERASLAAARTFLESYAGWLAARLAKLPERVPFVVGTVLPLRGEPHRIAPPSPRRQRARTMLDASGELSIVVSGDEEGVPGRVQRFLVAEAQADITAAVDRHTAQLGLSARRITVRDTTSRWGSCSATGALSFSWRLILAPPLVLDYLAAHEVAHLKELNHSQRFWRLTRDLCPATDEAEGWLKRHGSGLHRYG